MKKELLERFIRYAKITTTSDLHGTSCPTTECQWNLLNLLRDELISFGIDEVELNSNGYLIASLKSNTDKIIPVIGFMAHVDTSSDVSGENVNPIIHENYNGKPILLNDGIIIDPENDDFFR